MSIFDISDDSSYQDEESSESNKTEFKIAENRKHQLGGRTVSSLSVPTAGSQDNCASVSIPVPRCEIFWVFSSSRSLKTREKWISFAQFVYFLKNIIVNFIIQKLKSKHTSLKKYTN